MPQRTPTILDIAAAAGVSRTTASAALTGGGRVSEATRERVRAVAEELGYTPNPAARHLRSGRTGALGVYLAEEMVAHQFYMAYTFGVAEAARRDGFAVTLIVPPADGPAASTALHVDGVIVPDPIPGDPMVDHLLASDVPVITSERYNGPGPAPRATIWTDYAVATSALLDHLWDRGARRPLLFTAELEIPVIKTIEKAYHRWCEERGVPQASCYLPIGSTAETIRARARPLLEADDAPDAVLAGAETIALPVMQAARELGRDVGHDLLLASCVDNPALHSMYDITAIEAPPRDIGGDAAHAMLELLRGEDIPTEIRREAPTLRLRGSTAGLVQVDPA